MLTEGFSLGLTASKHEGIFVEGDIVNLGSDLGLNEG